MKEDRQRSKQMMQENTKRQNYILGEDRKKRLYQDMEEKYVQDVEMPELERRKHELAKRRNFMQQRADEGSVKQSVSSKMDQYLHARENKYTNSYDQKKSKSPYP
jgi:hypothetical protein